MAIRNANPRTSRSRAGILIGAATAALLTFSLGAYAADIKQQPTKIKAASCGLSNKPNQCSPGERCVDRRCVPDPKGPKTGPIQKR